MIEMPTEEYRQSQMDGSKPIKVEATEMEPNGESDLSSCSIEDYKPIKMEASAMASTEEHEQNICGGDECKPIKISPGYVSAVSVDEMTMEIALKILQETAYLSDYDSDGNVAVPADWEDSEEEDFEENLHMEVDIKEEDTEVEVRNCEMEDCHVKENESLHTEVDIKKEDIKEEHMEGGVRNWEMEDCHVKENESLHTEVDIKKEDMEGEVRNCEMEDCHVKENEHSNQELGSCTKSTSEPHTEAVHIQSPSESPSTEQEKASIQVNEVTACRMGQPTRQRRRKQIIQPREEIIEESPEEVSPLPKTASRNKDDLCNSAKYSKAVNSKSRRIISRVNKMPKRAPNADGSLQIGDVVACTPIARNKEGGQRSKALTDKSRDCATCGKGFRRDLKRHEMIHSGENLFECSTCGKVFSKKGPMEKHNHSHCIRMSAEPAKVHLNI